MTQPKYFFKCDRCGRVFYKYVKDVQSELTANGRKARVECHYCGNNRNNELLGNNK